MERRKVDLPHPDGPISAVIDRGWITTSISCSACLDPYQNENFLALIAPGCWCMEDAAPARAAGRESLGMTLVIRSGR